jgi:hypothetical protein
MKKTFYKLAILCFLAFVYANEAKAQGNLQFNQVKLVSASDTVPANKVWKVESILCANFNTSMNANSTIRVNGNFVLVRIYSASGAASWEMKYPFWLPAGSSIAANVNVDTISVIEYNIIP